MEINNITINLLSDLAVGAGESYQSGVDQDIVYDDFGFPYIPAKRLKGCIRESALEQEELYNQVLAEAGVKLDGEMVGANKDKLSQNVTTGPQKQMVGAEGAGSAGGAGAGDGGAGGMDDDLDAMLKSLNQK